MNYEKAYKEAFERAKNLHKDAIDMGENIRAKQCEIIFPELKESEDEKIRKTLIEYFNAYPKDYFGGLKKSYIVAWLEKQGEKKSSDEVLKIRQKVYQSGYNDGYKHGIEDVKQGEQKSHAWSKEDERAIGIINLALEHPYNMEGKWDRKFALDWLKSLKQRMGG